LDTSEEYVKMCYKAPKELWDLVIEKNFSYITWRGFIGIIKPTSKPRKIGGLINIIPETLVFRIWLNENQDIYVLENTFKSGRNIYATDEGTPLYRQDQLQEIILPDNRYAINILFRFHAWAVNVEKPSLIDHLRSMEQLWLAFVMKEKFGKTWNGKKWH
jgi:hypothetical protein